MVSIQRASMSRQKCCRKIGYVPEATSYRPVGTSRGACVETVLSLDELEAVRLADYEGLYQEQAAAHMGVSRQTFGRIVESARKKIAGALVHGKPLKIEGGTVSLGRRAGGRCTSCNRTDRCPHEHRDWTCPRRDGFPKS